MWHAEITNGWERDHKHYAKKHPHELAAVLRNLERYLLLLNVSRHSKVVQAGYLHGEPMNIVAIDQKGSGRNLAETRLYTYADDTKRVVYLIAIGDKQSQHSDIEYCKEFVISLREESND